MGSFLLVILILFTVAFCESTPASSIKSAQLLILKEPPKHLYTTAPPTPERTIKEVVEVDDRLPIAAPMEPSAKADPIKYIKRYAKRAQVDHKKYGVPASISLAQGIVESRCGTSLMAVLSNNHFGMKCNSKHHRGCCRKYKDDSNNDSFIDFKSPELSWDRHAKLVTTGRYARLKKYGNDYRQWAYGLKKAGYATDKTYAQKIVSIIEKYRLYEYD